MSVENTLVKFFEKYKYLFNESVCASTGDADDILMDLMSIVNEENIKEVLEYVKAQNV